MTLQANCLQTIGVLDPASAVTMPDGSVRPKTEEDRFRELGPIAARHGRYPKGTKLPETHQKACPRVRVADVMSILPPRYVEALEQNQLIASCCRHPENHEIEAFRSHPEESVPDIYVFYCSCGRKHRRFCIGTVDHKRPVWSAS